MMVNLSYSRVIKNNCSTIAASSARIVITFVTIILANSRTASQVQIPKQFATARTDPIDASR